MPKNAQPASPPNIWECAVEGIEYVIDWEKFPINGFVFIRCLETDTVVKSIRKHAQKYGVGIRVRVGARDNYWGVGVWRVR